MSSPSASLNEISRDLSSAEELIRRRYPHVNDSESPLPKMLDPRLKNSFIQLSGEQRIAYYKGGNKSNKEAASVLADHPIPASSGIYYFEVEVRDKGRDGFIGVGVCFESCQNNKLPGWEDKSWGYHADDGHKFQSSGHGSAYGPTFTTGDIVGCCINFVERTCFYTKNGVMLGQAFKDLPVSGLYPVVGMQTAGEKVEVNFGQKNFRFGIEDYIIELKQKVLHRVDNFSLSSVDPSWHKAMQKLIASYLVHYGYSETARLFAKATDQSIEEELASISRRNRIQQLVLDGQIEEAIEETESSYPELLENNRRLLFLLKCQQFVELNQKPPMPDDQTTAAAIISRPPALGSPFRQDACSKSAESGLAHLMSSQTAGKVENRSAKDASPLLLHTDADHAEPAGLNATAGDAIDGDHVDGDDDKSPVVAMQIATTTTVDLAVATHTANRLEGGVEASGSTSMDGIECLSTTGRRTEASAETDAPPLNGTTSTASQLGDETEPDADLMDDDADHEGDGGCDGDDDGNDDDDDDDDDCDDDSSFCDDYDHRKPVLATSLAGLNYFRCDDVGSDSSDSASDVEENDPSQGSRFSPAYLDKVNQLLALGREITAMLQELGNLPEDSRLMEETFSLMCYPNPFRSPVAHLLEKVRRDHVASQLNSAILELHSMPKKPPVELMFGHIGELLHMMQETGCGSSAFINLSQMLNENDEPRSALASSQLPFDEPPIS